MHPSSRCLRGLLSLPPLIVLAIVPGLASGQSISGAFVDGEAFGIFVGTPLGNVGPTPNVELPPGGGSEEDEVLDLSVPTLAAASVLTAATEGSIGGGTATATSTAEVAGLQLLAGVITADVIRASASSTLNGGGASSTAAGTQFVNLVIAGTPIPLNPPANTTIPIPGVATVVLNEQIGGGDGSTSSSLTVNLLRVTLALGGQIVVGHAHSAVGLSGACTGSGASCSSADDCAAGEGCCGDGTVDDPPETCDLGIGNGLPGSSCSRSCGIGNGVCTGSGAVCSSAADCPTGEGCCGDGVDDGSAEACDLGDANGDPGSTCTATCSLAGGSCTGSGEACETSADCPAGEGCCGNGIGEGDEQCDDGNGIPDDACTNTCENNDGGQPVIGCEDLPGSSIVPLFVRRGAFTDKNRDGKYDRWKGAGDFSLFPGTAIDPDSESVRLVYNQGSTSLYDGTLPPGSFVQKGSATRPKWDFKNKAANSAGAPGWRKGRFKQKLNKVRTSVDGINSSLAIDTGPQPLLIRQTIRMDDVCATTILTCQPVGRGTSHLICRSGVR